MNVLALILALMLEQSKMRGKNFYRGVMLLPNTFSGIIIAFIWVFIFTKVWSGVERLTGFRVLKYGWFGQSGTAKVAVLITEGWRSIGYYTLVYVAGLQSIDPVYMDAAAIDGATGLQKFFRITLPLLMPSVIVCLFLTITNSFKMFDVPFIMTNGGPGYATNVAALDIYKTAFASNAMGYGCAKAILLSLVILTVLMIQLTTMKKKEVEI